MAQICSSEPLASDENITILTASGFCCDAQEHASVKIDWIVPHPAGDPNKRG